MFKDDLKDVPIKMGRGNLLGEAFGKYQELFKVNFSNSVADKYGKIAIDVGPEYLVAKFSSYGNIVSVSERIWKLAIRKNKRIVMYIKKSGHLYEYDPLAIDRYSINRRGRGNMVNFDIRWGTNLTKTAKNTGDLSEDDLKAKRFSETVL